MNLSERMALRRKVLAEQQTKAEAAKLSRYRSLYKKTGNKKYAYMADIITGDCDYLYGCDEGEELRKRN